MPKEKLPKLTKLNNVYIYTAENGQEYVRLFKDKWMLYEGDDEIINPEHLEEKFSMLTGNKLYDDETIEAMQNLLDMLKENKITRKEIVKLVKNTRSKKK